MRALLLLFLAGCAGLTTGAPVLAPTAGPSVVAPATAAEAPACTCVVPPPRIVRARDNGPTLLSPADLSAIERYVRACSGGR